MFASVSAEHFEGTIEYGDCRIHGEECYGCVYAAPDREIPFQPTNPVNPILVFARDYYEARMLRLRDVARGLLGTWDDLLVVESSSPEQRDHAREVLARLARLPRVTQ